ncbi:M20 family metallopeptidase [Pseudonocardia xishanensis]|uniref:Peptidase M20 domain-containing protein 2 n=1 Tax=Pseudonocardia xishanensis TaxID=630995 RepID=A0ABP8RX54_9PSEU
MTGPDRPDDGYLRALVAATERAVAAAEPLGSPFAGAPADLREPVREAVVGLGDELVALSRDLHAHPETSFEEHWSAAAVAEVLRRHGHDPEVGTGLDTALRCTTGGDGPHIGVLAEYDALPGIGHGCGHNVIAASAVGAFLGLAGRAPGRVTLFGTPAEEGGGGKETMARAGLFDDVDAVVMLHPFSHDVAMHPFLGRRQVEMVFHGVAAHASAQPFMGRNALDAAVSAYTGVAALRQHLPPSDRLHGTFTDGGARPNVVPDRAALLFYVRSMEPDTLRDLAHRVSEIAHGAARMHGCTVDLTWDGKPAYLPIRQNTALAGRWAANQVERGRAPLAPGIVPEFLTGSTDLGNLSYRMPAIHPMLAIAGPTEALHTVGFAEAAGGEGGDRGVRDGADGLALTALDYLADADLRAAVHAEFAAQGGPIDVPSFFA